MNKLALIYLLVAGLMLTQAVEAAAPHRAEFKVSNLSMTVENSILSIKMMVVSTFTKINSDGAFRIDPQLKNGARTKQLAPIVFKGKLRQKFDKRITDLNGSTNVKPFQTYLRIQNNLPYNTAYEVKIPYEDWMDNADLVMKGIEHDCCDEWVICSQSISVSKYGHLVNLDKKPEPVEPPKPVYVEPKVETPQEPIRITILPKTLDAPAIFVASVRYPQGGNSIFASFSTNPLNLSRIDTLINMIADAGDRVNLKAIRIIGYASPEGLYSNNQRLAEGRAGSVKNYMVKQYPRLAEKMKVSGVAEDWDGVIQTLKARHDFPRRDELIRMIENTDVFDGLETKIKVMDKGAIWQKLLKEVFPDLRRIDLEVEYTLTR